MAPLPKDGEFELAATNINHALLALLKLSEDGVQFSVLYSRSSQL